jgi:alkylation response protein AidB-like acyl-CoA dehydrogenase/putative sterol carrier protein
MGELGFLGINHPEAYGGTDVDFFYTVAYLEELARCTSAGFTAAVAVHQYMATAHIAKVGSHYLKERYLAPAISGEKWGALGISEPFAGSDVANIRTTAIKEGDHYIINGSKTFITNGVYGDFITLACKTKPEAGAAGISLIVVDTHSEGFSANKLDKIGWRSSDTGELAFDQLKVPCENLVGQENMGFYYIMDSFQLERLTAGVLGVSGAEHAIEITLEYMQEREAFGRKLKKFQVLRHRLADLATELEATKQLTHHTSWLFNNDIFAVKECSMVKLLASEVGKKVVDECLQCFGGYGYMEDYPIARMYRDARVGTIVGGTSEIMKEIIAKVVVDGINYESAYKQMEGMNSQQASPSLNGEHTMEKKPETARDIILSLGERFKVARTEEGLESRFHFDISGDRGGQFTVELKDGICQVKEGLSGEPKCIVKAKDKHYEEIELGKTNPQMAFMMGKIKISNLGEMLNFVNLFERLY